MKNKIANRNTLFSILATVFILFTVHGVGYGQEPEFIALGYATLSGAHEVPAIAGDAVGTAALHLDAGGNLHFNITVMGLTGPITGAHFHGPAAEDENADVIFGITDAFDGNHAQGVWQSLTDDQLHSLFDGTLYLNIHTEANPPGEIRGQVHAGENGMALLSGAAEVPSIEVNGVGTAVFKLINGGTALWYDITAANLTGAIVGAHFHGPAAADQNADVIFEITNSFDGVHAQGVWDGLTEKQLKELLDERVYLNIHTEVNPPGEIRGQVVGVELPPSLVTPPSVPEEFAEEAGLDVFFMRLDPGLNMISLPLMPSEPYTARRLAEEIGATIVIELDSATQRFVGFTVDSGEEGFPIEGGGGYIVNVPDGRQVAFVGTAWINQLEAVPAAPGVDPSDGGKNPTHVRTEAWAFVISGDVPNAEVGDTYTVVVKNRRTGAVAIDVTDAARGRFAAVWAELNRKSVVEAGDALEIAMLDERGNIVSGPFRRDVDISNIRKAYLSLPLIVGDVRPTETRLGQNFPNPFNPETWIPYQLTESAEVAIEIYDPSGRAVRTLSLGLKSAGFYATRETAAYWDGRNGAGEKVASGVYFYTLQIPDFTATRKMLIAK